MSDGGEKTEQKPKLPRPKKRKTKLEVRYARLLALSCYPEVYDKLLSGWPPQRVAELIHTRGEALDLMQNTLVSLLTMFRREVLTPSGGARAAKAEICAPMTLEGCMNVLEELENLYRVQARRITIGLQAETQSQKLNPVITKTAAEARWTLKQYHDVALAAGLIVKREKAIEGEEDTSKSDEIGQSFGDSARKVASEPKKVANVLNVFRRVMALTAASPDVSAASPTTEKKDKPKPQKPPKPPKPPKTPKPEPTEPQPVTLRPSKKRKIEIDPEVVELLASVGGTGFEEDEDEAEEEKSNGSA